MPLLNWSKCKATLQAKVSSSEIHLFWNLSGKAFAGLSSYITLPYLFSYFKPEKMGYFVMYQMVFTWLMVMDFGLGIGVNRMFSQKWQIPSQKGKAKQYFYAVEKLQMFLVLFFLIVTFVFYSGSLAIDFANSEIYVGIALALISYYPVLLYMNTLMGMLKFFQLNCFHFLYVFCKFYGAIFFLYYFQMTTSQYFLGQALINFFYVILLRITIHKSGIAIDPFCKVAIKECKALKIFSRDMGVMSILTMLIVQLDKWYLLVSDSLDLLGYYGMIWSL
ncbi:MAG TPA: hypothetical protein P5048_04895, partial [Chlamydiales bacterium]|nr:hypothetical protein [Chlamydiales bacterium]